MSVSRGGSLRALVSTLGWLAAFTAVSAVHYAVRGLADNFGRPTYSAGAIDNAVFGRSPVYWLQNVIPDRGAVPLVVVGLYASWFVVLIALQGIVLARCGPRCAARLLALHAALLFLADAIFFIMPTRPPWMDHGVTRVIAGIGASGSSIPDNNPHAAFPSLHVAMPLLYAVWFARHEHPSLRRLAPPIAIWTLAIGVAVVYGAEHYVASVVAGALCAVAVYLAGKRAESVPAARRIWSQLWWSQRVDARATG